MNTPTEKAQRAATVLIERDDEVLCVWNRNYHGWSLPGGKIEEGEEPVLAALRELAEETDIELRYSSGPKPQLVFEALSPSGRYVYVFRVRFERAFASTAKQMEKGSPIAWLPRAELAFSPFAPFYEKLFAAIEDAS